MVDLERIRSKIQVIQDELAKLDQIAKYDYEAFRSTPFVADASLRNLQIIIEALIDVSSHIVARQNLGLPKTYADVIKLMVQGGIIPAEKEETYVNMVKFRNRIVHMYDDVNLKDVHEILQTRLDDIREFVGFIVQRYFT